MGDGSDVSVAHGVPATIHVGTALDLHVRVRDGGGRPLSHATVFIGLSSKETDADGLALFPGASTSTTAFAAYAPHFDKTPGAKVYSQKIDLSKLAPFDPNSAEAPDLLPKELHVTLVVAIPYALKHLFGWQNKILRKLIYFDGGRGNTSKLDNPKLDRKLRLQEILDTFDPEVKKVAKLRNKKSKDKSDVDALAKKLEAEKAIRKKLSDARDASLTKDPMRSQANADKEIKKHDEHIDKMATELENAQKTFAADDAAFTAAQASHGGFTHQDLMRYIVDEFLPKLTLRDQWIHYAIVHLTGLRYRPSNGGYYAPAKLVYGFREKEIDELEHPSTPDGDPGRFAQRQRAHARAYLSWLKADAALLEGAAARYGWQLAKIKTGAKGRRYEPAPVKGGAAAAQLLSALDTIARRDEDWAVKPPPSAPKTKPKPGAPAAPAPREARPMTPVDVYALRAVASAVTQTLIASAGGTSSRFSGAPPDESEYLGEIVDRRFSVPALPDPIWKSVVSTTQLLNDFVEADWDVIPANWNRPKALGAWDRIYAGIDSSDWLEHHSKTMQPFVTAAECNDVASTLGRARGLPFTGDEWISKMAWTTSKEGGGAEMFQGTTGLFRPHRISEVQAGDIIFVGHWVSSEDTDKEVHIIPPELFVRLNPISADAGKPTQGLSQAVNDWEDRVGFAAALGIMNALPSVETKEDLAAPESGWAYAIETKRPLGSKNEKRASRIIRRSVDKVPAAPPAAKGAAPKVPATPPATDAPPVPAPAPPPLVPHWEMLAYQHIATVIEVDDAVRTFETAEPVGVKAWPWNWVSNPEWFFGRIPPGKQPDLSWFLDRENLIGKGRLDDD